VVALAPLFFSTPAEAAIGHSLVQNGVDSWSAILGGYTHADITVKFCDGGTDSASIAPPFLGMGQSYKGRLIKYVSGHFYGGGFPDDNLYDSWGLCGAGDQKKVATCGGFSIGSRVPRSPAVPVSFKGPGNITHASIYFKKLGYSLPLWLHHYDWGSGKWYGYLNTLSLPLGKHHGRVNTFVDGVKGGGCATGGFKVVDE